MEFHEKVVCPIGTESGVSFWWFAWLTTAASFAGSAAAAAGSSAFSSATLVAAITSFVFATTEPQKIQQAAAPILSRCQRFDFRRIGVLDIVARLSIVLAEEGAQAPEDALRIIARKADGGMRDALSLLDQVISLTGGEVDLDSVRRVLGLVEDERYLELVDVLRDSRHDAVFGLVQSLVDEGYDLVEFYHGLLDVLRTMLRLRLSPDADVDTCPGLLYQESW